MWMSGQKEIDLGLFEMALKYCLFHKYTSLQTLLKFYNNKKHENYEIKHQNHMLWPIKPSSGTQM